MLASPQPRLRSPLERINPPFQTLYTTEQVAQILSLSRSTVAEMLRRRDIRSVKLGGCRRIFRVDVDAYIASVRGEAS